MDKDWIKDFQSELSRMGSERQETKAEVPKLKLGERKNVTILFLDLKGFTSISESLDPEDVHSIVDNCFKYFTKDIEKFSGYVDKYEGDCIMALFGAKKSCESSAELAVRAALLMNTHLEEINQLLKERDIKLGMRTGINTGLVVTGMVGKERSGDFTVYGDAVNLASRLESNAPLGKILVSEDVYKIIKNSFTCADQGAISVKGKSIPVHVYTIEADSLERIERWERSRLLKQNIFVNREAEIQTINAFLAQPFSPSQEIGSRILTTQGSAGIGKSRLLYEVFKHFREKKPSCRLLWVKCISFESSYYPFSVICRQSMNWLKKEMKESSEETVLQALLKFLPEDEISVFKSYFPYLYGLLGNDVQSDLSEDPKERQLRFLLTIKYFFKTLFHYGVKYDIQFIVVLDDVQWIDTPSKEALKFLLDQLQANSLLGMFMIAREGFNLDSLIPSKHGRNHLKVSALGETECRKLVHSIIGEGVLSETLFNKILDLAQGNPYFLEELILSLEDRMCLSFESGAWSWTGESDSVSIPVTLEGLLLSKIDSLPKPMKELLQVASILGNKFSVEILSKILEKLQSNVEDIEEILNMLCQLNILSEEAMNLQAFSFTQNLLQETVYQSILKHNRLILHEVAADSYREAKETETCIAQITFHYLQSAKPHQSLKYLLQTVKNWVRDYRNEEALSLINRGLELLEGKELSRADTSYKWELLVEQEKISEILNKKDIWKDVIEKLVDMASKEKDSQKVGFSKNRLAWLLIHSGDFHLAIETAKEVLETSGVQGSKLQADAFRYIGLGYNGLGDYNKAEGNLNKAYELRKSLDDEEGEAQELTSLSTILWLHGDYEKAIQYLSISLGIQESRNDLRGVAHTQNNLGLIFWTIGDLDAAENYFIQAQLKYQQIGDRRGEGNTTSNLSLIYLYKNNATEAVNYARKALELSNKYSLFRLSINSRIYLAIILMDTQGNPDLREISELIESAIHDSELSNFMQGVMEGKIVKAELMEKQGKLEEAFSMSSEAYNIMQQLGLKEEIIYLIHARIASRLDMRELAKQVLEIAIDDLMKKKSMIKDKKIQGNFMQGSPYRIQILELQKRIINGNV